ncbi:hypothetical protein CKO51_28740 [Rhodopirellula sp. SM50]|nr:hypothetical protein CKO51_28740 [Rhodopirellula sp. SM50]
MSNSWFEQVSADQFVTQGDIICDCPVMGWKSDVSFDSASFEELQAGRDAFKCDVIVMTQACDLENRKVESVILCPCTLLSEFRSDWEFTEKTRKQNPSDKAFHKLCERIASGAMWNLTLLNHSGSGNDHRVVDFQEVYTIPRRFLEQFIVARGNPRIRLLPPYREHLSQSFARFFMRVGLPVGITDLP